MFLLWHPGAQQLSTMLKYLGLNSLALNNHSTAIDTNATAALALSCLTAKMAEFRLRDVSLRSSIAALESAYFFPLFFCWSPAQ